jgi:hypothetical protein
LEGVFVSKPDLLTATVVRALEEERIVELDECEKSSKRRKDRFDYLQTHRTPMANMTRAEAIRDIETIKWREGVIPIEIDLVGPEV